MSLGVLKFQTIGINPKASDGALANKTLQLGAIWSIVQCGMQHKNCC